MKQKTKNKEKLVKIFTCPKCGPYVRIMAELWSVEEGNMFALEFINQTKEEYETVFTIKMSEPKKPFSLERYYRCGHCDCYVGNPVSVPQSMLEDIENKITRDKALFVADKKDDKR